MASLNNCTFIGNLGKDVDVRYMKDGKPVASFSLACSESWKDKTTGEKVEKTEWVNVSAFGRLAEIMSEYLKKGSKIYISGKFTTDKYEKDGETKYSTKIIAREMIMLDSRVTQEEQNNQQPSQQAAPTGNDDFDESIPF